LYTTSADVAEGKGPELALEYALTRDLHTYYRTRARATRTRSPSPSP
jgi:hypothetical protein